MHPKQMQLPPWPFDLLHACMRASALLQYTCSVLSLDSYSECAGESRMDLTNAVQPKFGCARPDRNNMQQSCIDTR